MSEPVKTILVVEDEPSVLSFIQAALARDGHSVLAARDSETALEMAEDMRSTIDLLILDHSLRDGLSGQDVGEIIRGARPDVKLLRMSGHSVEKLVRDGLLEENDNFLAKPFGWKDLSAAVKATLEE